MTPDELISRAAAQPDVEVRRLVAVHGPELKRLLDGSRAVPLLEIMSHPDQTKEQRTFRYKHILEPGASQAEVEHWQVAHPLHQLPVDMTSLLVRVNGIHLWADADLGRSYYGVLPLKEWSTAEAWDWNFLIDGDKDGCVVMSYHDNSDHFLLLDTEGSAYYLVDGETGDKQLLGTAVETFLTSWWEHADVLDPRREGG